MTSRLLQLVALVGMCLFAAALARGAERQVSSVADVEKAARAARPGDTVVIADGTYKDWNLKIDAKGTAEQPVTVRAQTPGKVRFEGNYQLSVDGEHVVVSGLFFGDSKSTKDVVEIHGIENRLTECAIVAMDRGGKWIHFMAGARRCRMDHCYLEGHAPEDVRLQVEVDEKEANDHHIDHNHFGPRPELGKNGGETMRIGYSGQSMRTSRTVVEHNLYDRCDGEL